MTHDGGAKHGSVRRDRRLDHHQTRRLLLSELRRIDRIDPVDEPWGGDFGRLQLLGEAQVGDRPLPERQGPKPRIERLSGRRAAEEAPRERGDPREVHLHELLKGILVGKLTHL